MSWKMLIGDAVRYRGFLSTIGPFQPNSEQSQARKQKGFLSTIDLEQARGFYPPYVLNLLHSHVQLPRIGHCGAL